MHLAAQLEAKRLMLQRAVTIDPAKPLAPQAAQTIDPLTGQPFRIEQVGEGYVLWSAELEPGFRADMEERSRLNQLQILAVQVGTDQWPAVLGVEQWRERWGR